MGVVRIDDELLQEINNFLEENGNKYKYPSISAFINNAVYEKLQDYNKKNSEGK
jgi:metal-responsive CopG/Arc/MetJ family transcriptional regulator